TAPLVFMGFFLTFFPQFLLGNAGMPRRYASYPEKFQALHVLSSGGAAILGLAMLVTAGYLLHALLFGPRAGKDPWRSRSFEWLAGTPPLAHNFEETPVIDRGPYDYYASLREEDEPS